MKWDQKSEFRSQHHDMVPKVRVRGEYPHVMGTKVIVRGYHHVLEIERSEFIMLS